MHTLCNVPQIKQMFYFGFSHFITYPWAVLSHPFGYRCVSVRDIFFNYHSCGQHKQEAAFMTNKFHASAVSNFICLEKDKSKYKFNFLPYKVFLYVCNIDTHLYIKKPVTILNSND